MSLHLFLFYRDLRLYDNTTLMEMARTMPRNDVIVPIFLYDRSEWKSTNQYEFLIDSLMDLDESLRRKGTRLFVMTRAMVRAFIQKNHDRIQRVGWNVQYERPQRYDFLRSFDVVEMYDNFLVPPDTLRHKPFKKFTPFYRHCISNYRIRRPRTFQSFRFCSPQTIPTNMTLNLTSLQRSITKPNRNHFYTQAGYRNAVRQLHIAKRTLRTYGKTRNCFSIPTSYLSSYLSLNILSIRQVYHIMKPVSQDFIRELFWRDFYLYVTKYFPSVVSYGSKPALTSRKRTLWRQWMSGRTGKPIVDACMRQMNTTGYMHNRGRMIVASYLIKNMHIPFKYGEEYFEKTLIDHNLSSNNGGWQWVNGTGIDSQPPYQKFNVYIQQKKYDPECVFVRLWIPEYQDLSNDDIFGLYDG